MKITLETYNNKYTAEIDHDDVTAEEAEEFFARLLVSAGYPASVLEKYM